MINSKKTILLVKNLLLIQQKTPNIYCAVNVIGLSMGGA